MSPVCSWSSPHVVLAVWPVGEKQKKKQLQSEASVSLDARTKSLGSFWNAGLQAPSRGLSSMLFHKGIIATILGTFISAPSSWLQVRVKTTFALLWSVSSSFIHLVCITKWVSCPLEKMYSMPQSACIGLKQFPVKWWSWWLLWGRVGGMWWWCWLFFFISPQLKPIHFYLSVSMEIRGSLCMALYVKFSQQYHGRHSSEWLVSN